MNELETYSQDGAICPYCAYENSPSGDDAYELYDEEADEFECMQCEQIFSVRLYVSHAWTCTPIALEIDETDQP